MLNEATEKQHNLINSILEFSDNTRPRVKADQKKKEIVMKRRISITKESKGKTY